MSQFNQQFITAIIDRYGLELDDDRIDNIVVTWLQKYDNTWIVKAIVESLHRGRYKVKSVDSILSGWHRIGKPCHNFTAEFEREILQNLPPILDLTESQVPLTLSASEPDFSIVPIGLNIEDLNPEESTPFSHHHHSTPTIYLSIEQRAPMLGAEEYINLANSQPRFLAIFQGENTASSDRQEEAQINHTIYQPTNFQLFQTLKAIVESTNSSVYRSDHLATNSAISEYL